MSHNLYTINNEGGTVLSYHGANLGYIYIGHGEDELYQGSYAVGSKVEFYDSNPINTIDGASFTKRAGTNWIQEITLPAGKYLIHAYTLQPLIASIAAYISYFMYIYDGVTETAYNPPNFATCNSMWVNESQNELREVSFAFFELTASRTIYFKINQVLSGTRDSAGNRQSKSNFLFLRKLE